MLLLSTPRQSNTLLVYGQSSKPVKWRNASRNAMDLQWQYARIFRTGVQARGWEPGWVFKVLGLKKSLVCCVWSFWGIQKSSEGF